MRVWQVCDVALVDLDGDGALDLYVSTWMHGSHIFFNRGGEFSADAHVELPRATEICAASTAFADVDRDGLIDIVTGGATFESWYFYPEPAVNRLWHNRGGGKFEPEVLPGPEGDTLTLLFTDLNGDGWPDLLVGNDFDEPDRIYLNDSGKLRPVKAKDAPLPYSGMTTMSFDTGDLDNDGKPELYLGQIAMGRMNELPKRLAPPVQSCGIYTVMADIARCTALARFQAAVARGRDTWTVGLCKELPDYTDERDCAVVAYYWTRILLRLPASGADKAAVLADCAKIPADFTEMHDVCDEMANSPMDYNQSHKVFTEELPSMAHSNILFASDGKSWVDVTKKWGAGYGGWSWNSKFADLDNDTWQDLFIVQGTRLRLYNPSNVFYRNKGGTSLEDATHAVGLEDHLPTASFLFLDYNLDGALDLITFPLQLTPVVWRNQSPRGAGFEVRLDDRRTANRYAIGARVEIRAPDGRLQMRDIKASGGQQSHDLLVARFGLGDWPEVGLHQGDLARRGLQRAQGSLKVGPLPFGAAGAVGRPHQRGMSGARAKSGKRGGRAVSPSPGTAAHPTQVGAFIRRHWLLLCALFATAAAVAFALPFLTRPAVNFLAQHQVTLARTCLAGGQREEAAAALRKALHWNPALAEARGLLGGSNWSSGDWSTPFSNFSRSPSFEPRNAEGWLGLVHVREKAGQPEEAAAAMDQVLELAPETHGSRTLRSELRYRVGRYQGAYLDAQRAVQADAKDARAWLALARAAAQVKGAPVAIGEAERGLASTGGDAALDPGALRACAPAPPWRP